MGEIGDHYRDLKEHRKQVKGKLLKNPPRRRCWDWIVTNGDYHYAKNRSSFKEYRRIKAKVGLTRVIGIGTIELQVERKDSTTYKLVLEDVLHTPSAICNGFVPSLTDCTQVWSATDSVEGKDESGQSLWYTRGFYGLPKLVLVNNPEGESGIERAKTTTKSRTKIPFSLSLCVNQAERDKIEDQNIVLVGRGGAVGTEDKDNEISDEDEDLVIVEEEQAGGATVKETSYLVKHLSGLVI